LVALDEKQKLAIVVSEHSKTLKTIEDRVYRCIIDIESLRAVHGQIKAEKGLDTSAKNVLWQEIVAALNRRKCVSNELADELIKGEWRI